LPPTAALYNPIDIIGDARDDRYKNSMEVILEDPDIDSILTILTPQAMSNVKEIAECIAEVNKTATKPIFTSFIGGNLVDQGAGILNAHKVPNYAYPERAVKAIETMSEYRMMRQGKYALPEKYSVDKAVVRKIIDGNMKSGEPQISESDAREILIAYGIRVPETLIAHKIDDAVKTADKIGYPVVLKIFSPDVIHKSDVGGVKVNLKNADEVKEAYNSIISSVSRAIPDAHIEGVQVTKMVTGGKEIIIGVTKDPSFGSLIMFGMGGIYVEVLKDVSFRIAPLTSHDAEVMIREIKMFPLLKGVRGEKGVDLEAVKESLLRISQLVCDFPEILEMDINPFKAYEKGAESMIAIDSRITIALE